MTRLGETIPPAARKPLVQLDVWDRFIQQGHASSPATVSAWGTQDLHENHFIFNPHGNGWHLDRRRFDEMLASSAAESGAAVYRRAQINACRRQSSKCWELEYVRGGKLSHLKAEFVIDATGRASLVARRRGARRVRLDRLIGIIGVFSSPEHAQDQDHRTLVEAGPDGWWYYALLPGQRIIAAYMTDGDLIPKGRELLVTHWRNQLQKTVHIRPRLSGLQLDEPFRLLPAGTEVLDPIGGSNWLAVGDSAVSFDPLSSQGIYRALQSGLLAGETVQSCWSSRHMAVSELSIWAQKSFNVYWQNRLIHYRREDRWPNSAFWRRRIGRSREIGLETSQTTPNSERKPV